MCFSQVLGAVPDAAIILASGLGEGAQEKLSVGMGTLAGSTVMLLTVAWSASLFVGRLDFHFGLIGAIYPETESRKITCCCSLYVWNPLFVFRVKATCSNQNENYSYFVQVQICQKHV